MENIDETEEKSEGTIIAENVRKIFNSMTEDERKIRNERVRKIYNELIINNREKQL